MFNRARLLPPGAQLARGHVGAHERAVVLAVGFIAAAVAAGAALAAEKNPRRPDDVTLALSPGSDTGDSGTDRLTRYATPTLAGKAPAKVRITIMDGDRAIATITASAKGTWKKQLPRMRDGVHRLALAGFGITKSPTLAVTVDTEKPKTPTIGLAAGSDRGVSRQDRMTNDTRPTLSGRTSAGAVVAIRSRGEAVGTARADGKGRWRYKAAALAAGMHRFVAVAADRAGNVSAASRALEVEVVPALNDPTTIALRPSSDTGASSTDRVTAARSPLVHGRATPGATVTVRSGAMALETAAASAEGEWSARLPDRPDGTHAWVAEARDAAGNAGPGSETLTVVIDTAAPGVPSLALDPASDTGMPRDRVTRDATPRILGTAEAGATVAILVDGNGAASTAADAGGGFAVRLAALADGPHAVIARATDLAGNIGEGAGLAITIDTAAPAVSIALDPASDTGASSSDRITADATPTVGGGAPAGATVTVREGGTIRTTAVSSGAGTWSATLPALADSAHTLVAVATDAAGNTSAPASLALTIDMLAPSGATIALAPASDSFFVRDGITSDNTPTLAGTAPAGAAVTVRVVGVPRATAVAGGDGEWTATIATSLADGVHTLLVDIEDGNGNLGVAVASLALTIDTTAPVAPSTPDLAMMSDSGVSSSDNVTRAGMIAITGTTEPGITARLTASASDYAFSAGIVADAEGNWSYTTSTLPAGTYTAYAEGFDQAGLTGPRSGTLTFVIDRTPPTLAFAAGSDTGISDSDGITASNAPSLTGAAEDGATVTIDGAHGESATATFGAFSLVLEPLADGEYTVTATSTDAAGNTGAASAGLDVVIDRTPPGAPTVDLAAGSDTGASQADEVTAASTLLVQGTAEAEATVIVRDGTAAGATEVAVTTANGGGVWSSSPILGEGTHELSARATDLAGNTGDPATLAVTIDATPPPGPAVDLSAESDTSRSTDDITGDTTPTLQGTTEAGATLTLYEGGATVDGTATTGGGSWSISTAALAAGDHVFTATATDVAGNASSVGNALTVTVEVIPAVIDLATLTAEQGVRGGHECAHRPVGRRCRRHQPG